MIRDIVNKNETVKPNQREMEALRKFFPQCFKAGGKFDVDSFCEAIKDEVSVVHEGYDLNFLGKGYSKLTSSMDTTTVIRPDVEHNAAAENRDSKNIYISGDNLDALKHLLKSYAGRVKCIYIDPPYNTGSDGFVYNDKFNFTEEDLVGRLSMGYEQAQKLMDMTRRGSASHSAWLTFMSSRLLLARDLLTEDGVIFISIDDNEQANLKLLCDSIFGEENFVASIPWRKRTAKSDVPFGVSQDYEYILAYASSAAFLAGVEGKGRKYYETEDFPGRPWRFHDMTTQRSATERPNCYFTIVNPKNGEEFPPNPLRVWANNEDTFRQYYDEGRIIFPGDYDFLNITKPVIRYWKEDDVKKAGEKFGQISVSTKLPEAVGMSQDGTKEITNLFGAKVFSYPKPSPLIRFLLDINMEDDDIVLDFFSGSATTADAVMQLNASDKVKGLRYILVQLPEQIAEKTAAYDEGYRTIDEIGQARIKRAAEKIRKETSAKIDYGFRHYILEEPSDDTLERLDRFSSDVMFADENILEEFGRETVLETWCVRDGYGFGAAYEEVRLDTYTAYMCGKHLYLTDGGLNENDVVALIDRYNSVPDFCPDQIVLFGYSFTFSQAEMLRKNLVTLRDSRKNLKINIDARY